MSNVTDIVGVDQLQAQVAPVVARAAALAIVTPDDYLAATEFAKGIKGAQKQVDAFFDPMVRSAHDTWKAALAQKATFADPLKQAEATTKQKLLAWEKDEERRRQEEQARLQAEADEAARRERERLEREAAKLKTPELREARMAQAATVAAPVVHVPTVAPKVAGQSTVTVWRAQVTDFSQVPREYLMVNDSALQAFARATKGAAQLPGVRFYAEQVKRIGGR